MRKRTSKYLTLLASGLAMAYSSHAGTYNNDFSNPDAPGLTLVGGVRGDGSAYPVVQNGYLVLTFAENSLQGSAFVDDLDPGVEIGSFTANFKVRVGGGSSTPADGWSFLYASNLDVGTAFGEEGPENVTGLTISFDNYDNGGGEAPAIDVKWNGQTIAHKTVNVFDLLSDTFVPVSVTLNSNGTLDLSYRGTVVYDDLFIPGFAPITGGRFAFGARTGGLNANHWVDDLAVTTTAAGAATAPTIGTQPASQTVAEHASVTFSVIPLGTPPFTFQWLSNNVEIADATGPSYTIANAPFSANTAKYSVRVSNATGNITSQEATLTVQQDTVAPTIASAVSTETSDKVIVTFSEPVTAATAGSSGNYSLSGGLTISGVTVLSPTQVQLATSAQAPGTTYTLTVNGVADVATIPNTIAANSTKTFSSFVESKGFLKIEVWDGIAGNPVDDLLTNDRYISGVPDLVGYISSFTSRSLFPTDARETYGARISGFITPTVSGDYRFFISSDDGSRLYLSSDANPANLVAIAEEPACCNGFTEPENTRTSAPIPLVAGQKYAVMYVYKEGVGGDYGMVAWRLETDTTPAATLQPISGAFLSTLADPGLASIQFDTQPQNLTAAENTTATFSVAVTASPSPVFVQWQRAEPGSTTFVDIAGANTLTYTTPVLKQAIDNGAKYRAVVSVPGGSSTSAEAALTVNIDNVLPTLVSVTPGVNLKYVTLKFSEALQNAPAVNKDNYTIPGLTVTSATLVSSDTVKLATSAQTQNTAYTVTVSNNVKDSAGNSIDPAAASANFQSLVIVPGIREDFYTGIGGTAVAALLTNSKYPNSPDETRLLAGFDAVNGYGENYGATLTGFVTPAESGDYRFFVRSDDASQLFISTDDDPANLSATPIAREDGCCQAFQEPGALQTSEPVSLVAGRSYYILFAFKEGGGGDWAQLAWRLETDPTLAADLRPIGRPFVTTAVSGASVSAVTLPVAAASPVGSGQTPGFVARIYQVNQDGATVLVNNISRAEQELAGIIGPNVADLSLAVNGVFPVSGVINWNADPAEAGNFQSISDPSRPDAPVPGIPGTGANTARNTDNIAGEIMTYVEFPAPGFYFLGVNSDDGFNVTATEQPPVNNRALVISGGAAAGSYYAVGAGSDEGGVFLPITAPIMGKLVQAAPADGCTPLTNIEELRGNIALIDRGVCGFSVKIQAAKDAGAIAVVMVNSRDPGAAEGIWPIVMGGTAVDLPAVMITKPDGAILKAALASGQLDASITPDATPSLGRFNGGRGASDTIFPVNVPQAGVYPLRTVWFEGDGGANVELFSVTDSGQKILLNDLENPNALKTFQTRTVVTRPALSIARNGNQITITWTGGGTLETSPAVTGGTWTSTNDSDGSYTTTASEAAAFFRVRR